MRERRGVRGKEEQDENHIDLAPPAQIPNTIGVQRVLDPRASVGGPTSFLQRTGQTMGGDKNNKRSVQ